MSLARATAACSRMTWCSVRSVVARQNKPSKPVCPRARFGWRSVTPRMSHPNVDTPWGSANRAKTRSPGLTTDWAAASRSDTRTRDTRRLASPPVNSRTSFATRGGWLRPGCTCALPIATRGVHLSKLCSNNRRLLHSVFRRWLSTDLASRRLNVGGRA